MSDGQMPLTHIKQAAETDEERIWRLATLAEREACAKIADEATVEVWYNVGRDRLTVDDGTATKRKIAAKIRARGKA